EHGLLKRHTALNPESAMPPPHGAFHFTAVLARRPARRRALDSDRSRPLAVLPRPRLKTSRSPIGCPEVHLRRRPYLGVAGSLAIRPDIRNLGMPFEPRDYFATFP